MSESAGLGAIRVPEFFVPFRRQRFVQFSACASVVTLLCTSVLSPPITISGDLPYVKGEQALLPLVIAVYCWLLLAGMVRKMRFSSLFIVGALYCVSILLSTWYGAAVLHHSLALRDFYELPKVLFPVAFFAVAYEADLTETSLRTLLSFFAATILLVCFYAWGQFIGLDITYPLNAYYSAGEHVDRALRYIGRVYSTMGNPNVLGQLMSWSIVLFTMAALSKVGSRALNIFLALACCVTLGMTGSRYGLVTTILGIGVIPLFPSSSFRRRTAQISLLVLLLVPFIWIFMATATADRDMLQRFETLRDPLQTDSARQRTDLLWRDALSDFGQSPLLGHGPAKTFFSGIITDSEYLDVLKEFGIVGFSVYILYFLLPLFRLWRGLRIGQRADPSLEDERPAAFLVLRASLAMAVMALVMNIGMSTLYNQLVQGFLWMWMGLGVRAAQSIIEASA